jgi:hypothetical protein
MFVKGLGSSGDTGTIDDNYPAAFLYLWRQPELINALLRPVHLFMRNYTYRNNSAWPLNVTWQHPFSIHFLGQYPIAELQCWGEPLPPPFDFCEAMPLEATADSLQMTVAAALASGDTTVAEEVWPLLVQYAEYLVGNGLDPTIQVSNVL